MGLIGGSCSIRMNFTRIFRTPAIPKERECAGGREGGEGGGGREERGSEREFEEWLHAHSRNNRGRRRENLRASA
jgi:hypothetical protein